VNGGQTVDNGQAVDEGQAANTSQNIEEGHAKDLCHLPSDGQAPECGHDGQMAAMAD
jgi:hypothetical protein